MSSNRLVERLLADFERHLALSDEYHRQVDAREAAIASQGTQNLRLSVWQEIGITWLAFIAVYRISRAQVLAFRASWAWEAQVREVAGWTPAAPSTRGDQGT